MTALTDVTLTTGVPTAGSGTVSTLDKFNGTAGSSTTQALTVQGIASGTAMPVSVATIPSHAVTNAGTFAVQVTSAPTTAVTLATAPALVASSATIGNTNIQISGTAPDVGSGTGGSHTIRTIIDSSQLGAIGPATYQNSVSVTPAQTSDSTASRINAAASTNATSLKASAGIIRTIDVFNVAAYNVFLKLYNKASAPTVGTDTPVMTIPIPAGGGYSKTWPSGFPFSTGIAYAITKLQTDSDTTVLVAGDLTGNTSWI